MKARIHLIFGISLKVVKVQSSLKALNINYYIIGDAIASREKLPESFKHSFSFV